MIFILVSLAAIILVGFVCRQPPSRFDWFSAFMIFIACFILATFVTGRILGNIGKHHNTIAKEGVYEIIPLQILDRKGSLIETYNGNTVDGLFLNIKDESGIITPIHLGKKYDYEIFEDGELKLEVIVETTGSFWTTIVPYVIVKPYKIHIPQNSKILRHKVIG